MCVRSGWMSSSYPGPQTSTQQGAVGHQPAPVADEHAQQVELDRGQVDELGVAAHRAGGEVDLEAVHHDLRLVLGAARCAASAACRRATSSRAPNGLVT